MGPVFLVFYFAAAFLLLGNVAMAKRVRLLGGSEAKSGDIRYLLSLHRDGKHTCGAGIIDARFALTAAHCVVDIVTNEFKLESMKVVAGVVDLTVDDPSRIEIDVEDVYVPEVYNGTYWMGDYPEGDIAVLKLKKKLDLTRLQKLTLPRAPDQDDIDNSFYVNSVAVIAGYGWDEVSVVVFRNGTADSVGTQKRRLHVADAFVMDHVACEGYWDTNVYESNLCARVVNNRHGDMPRGICRGDSGSPLVYDDHIVIGVASGNILECNENITPSLYTRVSSYLRFIGDAMEGHWDGMRVKSVERRSGIGRRV